jgi:hypothetical protein
MDWGTVASVVVALALLVLGMITIMALMFGLAARGAKKKIKAGGIPKCPMPGCPFHKDIEGAIKAAKSNE